MQRESAWALIRLRWRSEKSFSSEAHTSMLSNSGVKSCWAFENVREPMYSYTHTLCTTKFIHQRICNQLGAYFYMRIGTQLYGYQQSKILISRHFLISLLNFEYIRMCPLEVLQLGKSNRCWKIFRTTECTVYEKGKQVEYFLVLILDSYTTKSSGGYGVAGHIILTLSVIGVPQDLFRLSLLLLLNEFGMQGPERVIDTLSVRKPQPNETNP